MLFYDINSSLQIPKGTIELTETDGLDHVFIAKMVSLLQLLEHEFDWIELLQLPHQL